MGWYVWHQGAVELEYSMPLYIYKGMGMIGILSFFLYLSVLIAVTMLHSNLLIWGISSKTSLKSALTSVSHLRSASFVAKISILSCIAPATLNSSVICGHSLWFLKWSLQTILSSESINFLSALVSPICSHNWGLGGGGGETGKGFNKS